MEEEVLNPIFIFNTDGSKAGRARMHLAATHVFFPEISHPDAPKPMGRADNLAKGTTQRNPAARCSSTQKSLVSVLPDFGLAVKCHKEEQSFQLPPPPPLATPGIRFPTLQ